MSTANIITRFAPSPTGYLHIGGARTALFNWAFARRHGGKFILRIEDTDAARSTSESTKRIIQDLRWLGLNWDEGPEPNATDVYDPKTQIGAHGPYFQSQRGHLYKEYLNKLMGLGRAYKCFKTPQQLTAERDKAKTEKRPYKYDPTEALNLTKEQITRFEAEGKPYVVRFRMPQADVVVHDLVLGDVVIKNEELEDFVIVKSDGGPTFHFANVVDDATMNVTHVLRAQEHLMNTPKHVAMFDALSIPRPNYAHMPLIFNPDGTKMSKRDKAKTVRAAVHAWLKQQGNNLAAFLDGVLETHLRQRQVHVGDPGNVRPLTRQLVQDFVEKKNDDTDIATAIALIMESELGVKIPLPEIDVNDFRASGYLPQVILNYIALLGWSPGNNLEQFNLDYLKQNFDIERLGKSNARFDRAKLLSFNAEAVARLSPEEFHERLRSQMAQETNCFLAKNVNFERRFGNDPSGFKLFAETYRPRCRTLHEPFDNGCFFALEDDDLFYDPKAVEKHLHKNDCQGLKTLSDLRQALESCGSWEPTGIHQAIKDYSEKTSLSLGDVAQPLRVAVSGSTVSPPINDTLAILGKKSTLARIQNCIAQFQATNKVPT